MKRLLAALCWFSLLLSSSASFARVERYAVLVGNNSGWKGEVELRYAESDALKVHDVLVGVGGFSPHNVSLLQGSNANELRRALIGMNDRIRQDLAGGGVEALLFVYYSGHGDAAALHAGNSSLDLQQIEQLVRGSAANFRILVLDACRSGALTRVKGGTIAPPLTIRTSARLAGEGVVFLTASSASEDAQESDALGGSFFTHYFTSGLMGAADDDKDGTVTLEEAYRHASESTIRATSRTFAGTQHPTFQYELRGQGKLPLTVLPSAAANRGTLKFPTGRTYLLMSGTSQGAVVAEVTATDVSRQLSLKPGRYFVRGRGSDFLLEGDVVAAAGATTLVEDSALQRVEYARLVRKGGTDMRAVHGAAAGYQLRTPFHGNGAACQGAFARYALELENFSLSPRLGFCRGGFENDTLHATSDQLDLSLQLAHSWDLPWVTVDLGVSAGGGLLRQTFETRGVAPPRSSGMGFIAAAAGLSRELPAGFFALAQVESQSYFFESQEHGGTSAPLSAAFALRFSLGLGRHF